MQRPPLLSEVVSRHGIDLKQCNAAAAKYRHCDAVLVMDLNDTPWREFFVRAEIVKAGKDWRLFVMEYPRYFNVAIFGNNRIPLYTVNQMMKEGGLLIDVLNDDFKYWRG